MADDGFASAAINKCSLIFFVSMEDEAGDVAAAREHYQAFLERWGETDLPVPAADEARERLTALGVE